MGADLSWPLVYNALPASMTGSLAGQAVGRLLLTETVSLNVKKLHMSAGWMLPAVVVIACCNSMQEPPSHP